MSKSDRTIIKLDAIPTMPMQGTKPKPYKMVAAYARVSTGMMTSRTALKHRLTITTKW